MRTLNTSEIQTISGGLSETCYNAYKATVENRSILGDLLTLIFLTPLGLIGKLIGEQSAVASICGSYYAYEEARAAYCVVNPWHCEKK